MSAGSRSGVRASGLGSWSRATSRRRRVAMRSVGSGWVTGSPRWARVDVIGGSGVGGRGGCAAAGRGGGDRGRWRARRGGSGSGSLLVVLVVVEAAGDVD